MLEQYFRYSKVLRRMRGGGLGDELDRIATYLTDNGYRPASAKMYLGRLARFSGFVSGAARGRPITQSVIDSFVGERETETSRMRAIGWVGTEPPDWSPQAVLATMDRLGIAMQMLSNIPKTLDALRASNDHGTSMVTRHPSRFGLLAALPTDDPDAALAEIDRAYGVLNADGLAVTFDYNGVLLSDARLDPVWAELSRRQAVVFAHPNAYGPGAFGRASALLDVAFETTATVVDMMYAGVFRRFPDFRLVLAHCGAALPALSGRLMLLGTQPWVANLNVLTREEMRDHLRGFYYDTAMTGSVHTIAPALAVTACDHIVYGSDCGVPCTVEDTMRVNIEALLHAAGLSPEQVEQIGQRAGALPGCGRPAGPGPPGSLTSH